MSTTYACLDEPAPPTPETCTAWESLPGVDFMSLSPADGSAIGLAIAMVWVTAYAFRKLARFLNQL